MSSGRIKAAKLCEYITLFSIYAIAFFLPISKGIIESLSILAIIAYLVKKFLNFDNLPKTPLNWGILAYLLVCILSIFLSSNFKISARTVFSKAIQDIAFFFVTVEALDKKKKLKNILYILFVSAAVLGIDGIYQYFTRIDFIRHRPVIFIERIYASFATPNSFGCYLSMVLPFLLANFFIKLRLRASKILYLTLFFLLFICLLLTISRGAWFAFIASALFMSIWIRALGISFLILGMLVIAMRPFYSQFLNERLANFFFFSDVGGIDRKIIWQAGWRMFITKPWLGLGLGTFMFNFKKFAAEGYPWGVPYAHNCYLQMAAEIGIIGLASFLSILALFFYCGIKTLNTKEKTLSWYVLLASQAAILGYCVQMGVDTTLYSLDLGILFWLVLGIGVAAMKNLQSACDTQR